jgi:tRNA(Arg) A34 adenosine deaminase TadA
MNPTTDELNALKEAISRARDAAGGGAMAGISAAIVGPDGAVAFGTNEVHLDNDPTRHAEIVAIGAAGATLGQADLSGHTLVSTLQPCEMCLAAMRFAGITRLVFAATKDNVAAKYFQFPSIGIEDYRNASDTPFDYAGGVLEAEVLDLYRDGQE